jgi:phasin family protein
MLHCSNHFALPKPGAPKGEETMTTKKTGAERAMKDGAETMRDGFEKAAKGYEQFVSFGKDNADAWMKSANVTGKGISEIHDKFFAFSRDLMDESVAATKAVLGSKNVQEAIEVQSDFVRSAFDTYLEQMGKFGDMAMGVAKDAAEPIQARANAFAEIVQNKRAA